MSLERARLTELNPLRPKEDMQTSHRKVRPGLTARYPPDYHADQENRNLKKAKGNQEKRIKICHLTHSFEWCSKETKATSITCDKLRNVKYALKRSSQFRELEKKNHLKELVVVRHGKPIPTHFPCTLIKPGEQVRVRFVKPTGIPKKPMAVPQYIRSDQPVEFNVLTKGGKGIAKITRNPVIRQYPELTVYGYKGEKVKRALKRDGRFLNTIFDVHCILSDTTTSVNTEMSNLVDELGGKTFQIIMLKKCSPPDSQSESEPSLEFSQTAYDSQSSSLDHYYSEQSAPAEQVQDDETEAKPNLNDLKHVMLCKIHGCREMRTKLSSLIRDFEKSLVKDQPQEVAEGRHLLRVEYGKSHGSFEFKIITKLADLTHSVCQVRVNDRPLGSGFLLFDTFVLTNAHIIKEVFNENTWQLSENMTVHFSFQSLGEPREGKEVLEVVAFEYGTDVSGHKWDWALLSIAADPKLPSCLLGNFGVVPQSGPICIIGHPLGGVQRFELTSIIPTNGRSQIIENRYNENFCHSETDQAIQFRTEMTFRGIAEAVSKSQDMIYESCFYFGSSGSPVFDSHGNLVAMHSGGYLYQSALGGTESVIEYGHPLSHILENLIVQLVQRRKLDVLKQYLHCPYKHHEILMRNVKNLVDSRNCTWFKNTANCSEVLNDDTLKEFFKFTCKAETPVSMDIDSN